MNRGAASPGTGLHFGSQVDAVATRQIPIDRPLLGGANDSVYTFTNGNTPVTVVAAPAADRYRVVYMVTAISPVGGAAIDVFWQVVGPASTYTVAQQVGLAAGAVEFIRNWQGGLVLLPGYKLQVVLGGAGVVPVSAHFAEPMT